MPATWEGPFLPKGTGRVKWTGALILCLVLSACRSTDDRVWLDQALAHRELEEGNAGRAIELLDRCKKDRPDYAPTYLSLAAAWAQRGDRDRFRENIAIYRQLNPTHDVADLYLAEADFKEGHWDQADILLEEFLRVTANHFDAKTLARRIHALGRRAEIADHRQDESNRHLFLARVEATKAWWLALQTTPSTTKDNSSRTTEDPRREILASLASSLEELQKARDHGSSQEQKTFLDQEIGIVTRMLQDAESGRLADMAFLLSARNDVETTAAVDRTPTPTASSILSNASAGPPRLGESRPEP
ncbi:hypothetical protein K2X85_12710 [bacterium]|nr:hypothetical protein [bacterium]